MNVIIKYHEKLSIWEILLNIKDEEEAAKDKEESVMDDIKDEEAEDKEESVMDELPEKVDQILKVVPIVQFYDFKSIVYFL